VTPLECPREADVIDAIAAHRWPERADQELRAHVASCAICADVAEVAAAMSVEHEAASSEVVLPPADLVWLRAQARARAAAAREAARPIAIMQALGLASAAGVMSLAIGFVAYWVWARSAWLLAMPAIPAIDPGGLDSMGFAIRGTLLAIGLWLVLAPVAVYLVASDD
jgi:hypothetical protein